VPALPYRAGRAAGKQVRPAFAGRRNFSCIFAVKPKPETKQLKISIQDL